VIPLTASGMTDFTDPTDSTISHRWMIARTERGATVIEAVVALSVLAAVITTGFAIMYLAFARVWIERCSYEATICLASSKSEAGCERRLRRDIQTALPIGDLTHISLSRTDDRASVNVRFAMSGSEVIRHRDSRALPLIAAHEKTSRQQSWWRSK